MNVLYKPNDKEPYSVDIQSIKDELPARIYDLIQSLSGLEISIESYQKNRDQVNRVKETIGLNGKTSMINHIASIVNILYYDTNGVYRVILNKQEGFITDEEYRILVGKINRSFNSPNF